MSFRLIFQGIFALTIASTGYGFDHSHSLWTKVLQKFRTSEGLIRYAPLKNEVQKPSNDFMEYLASLQSVKFSEYQAWSKPEKKAFLINAYNAMTIKLIIDHYPLGSITDIGGMLWRVTKKPWKMEFFSLLEGRIKSLDPIEQEYLRSEEFRDYRVHAALNCASYSCPPLRHDAYVGEKIELQLDDQMKIWLSDLKRNQFDINAKKVHLSKIFDWYQDDFKKWGASVNAVLEKYTPEGSRSIYSSPFEIDYLDYNWDLNDAKSE